MTMFNRRVVAALAAATLVCGLAACGDESVADGSEGTTDIQLMMFPGQAYRLPILVAEQQGWMADEGLNITIVAQPSNIPGSQGLEATGSDINQFSIATLAQGVQAGQEAKIFCGTLKENQSSIVASVDSDLPSVADGASVDDVIKSLTGKVVGGQTPEGGGFQKIVAAELASGGATDFTYVNLGGTNTGTGPALSNGAVDVAIANPPGTQALVLGGQVKELAYLPSGGPEEFSEWYGSGWGATTEWLDANPDAADAFCRVTQKAIDFIQDPANLEASVAALVEDTELAEDIATAVVETAFEPYSSELDEDVINKTLEGYVEAGILKAEPAITWDNLVDDHSPRQ